MHNSDKESTSMTKEFWMYSLGIILCFSIVIGGLGFLFASEINVGLWIKDGWYTYSKRVFAGEEAIKDTKQNTDKIREELDRLSKQIRQNHLELKRQVERNQRGYLNQEWN